jgi:membrane protein implicated in regulation of membrane protease activity
MKIAVICFVLMAVAAGIIFTYLGVGYKMQTVIFASYSAGHLSSAAILYLCRKRRNKNFKPYLKTWKEDEAR